jgi:DNA polymerase elongation subunit (family B)
MNAYSNKMIMDREIIADKGIWTAKKRYMLNVLDSEGIRYKKPKLKIMGIETTRSSTPAIVREKLKQAISLIMLTDESTVQAFISTFKEEFVELDPEEVSFPRGVSNLEKYKSSSSIYSKGTPIAVKGALLYNYFIKQKNLDKKYNLIIEGDKVKFTYLKEPNPISTVKGEKVISFVNSLPKELDLHRFVDYNKQFDVAFLDPLKTILNVIGWDTEKRSTLESLFC